MLPTARRARAGLAAATAALAALLLLLLSASGPVALPRPPAAASLPGPYIIHAATAAAPHRPTSPLPSLAFALAPRPNHSDDAALAALSSPSRSATFWGGDAGGADPPTFTLADAPPPPPLGAREPVGVRVVRAAVLARRRADAGGAISTWLAAPPAVVWLPGAVARALAGAAAGHESNNLALLADARLGAAGGVIFSDAALAHLDAAAGRAAWAACLNETSPPTAETCLAAAGLTVLDARYGGGGVPLADVDPEDTAPAPGDGGVAQLLADALLADAGACGTGSRCRAAVDQTVGAVLTRLGDEEPPVPGVSPIEAEAAPAAAPAAALAGRLVVAALTSPATALHAAGVTRASEAAPADAALLAAAARVREAVAAHCPAIDLMPAPTAEGGEEGSASDGGAPATPTPAWVAAAQATAAADAVSAATGGACAYAGFQGRRAVGESSFEAVVDLLRTLAALTG